MTIRNLERMLAPASVALIGASPEPGSVGRIVAENLWRGGFAGPVRLVNPRHDAIDGRPCHASVAGLPEVPDLAVVATPPATVPGIVAELAERGTRAAVVITAGIKGELRQAMLDAARPRLLRILGPNCLGLMLPGLGLDASFSHTFARPGDLALVSQSGALITAIADWSVARGIGFSHVVSLGDMADVDFGDMLDYLAADSASRAILLYMESLTGAAKFLSAARRAARVKPVVVIKSGRHAEGAKAALSHTGALAGADAAYEAAFRRAGLLRVNELEDLFNAAEMLSHAPRLEGERLLILTNGGGAGVLAADRLADLGGALADLPADTVEALDAVLPSTWSRANPVDIIGDAGAARYGAALERLLATPTRDAILVMNCPTALASSTDVARAVIDVRRAAPIGPLLANWLGDGAAAEARAFFAAERIPSFETPAAAIEGFMQLVRHKRAQDELMRTPPPMPEGEEPDVAGGARVIASALASGRSMLSEVEAKRLLACHRIAVAEPRIAASPEAVIQIAGEVLRGADACVVKILSDDITHKSDVGGVRLGLASPEAAGRAAAEMAELIGRTQPSARLAGFTVEPMVRRPHAQELILGMSEDETFGPMLTFGAGGTAVEVLRDTALALPPIDLKLALDLMRRTRIFRLLEGYRDRPRADLDAIAATLVRLSALVIAHPEIRELDINPLLADERGVIALDARVRVEDNAAKPRRPLAIRPYPSRWERSLSLPTVGDLRLRPIRPEDARLYQAFIERLAPEDLRLRFFNARPDLSPRLIARFTQIDYAREMAFVAMEPARDALLGVARLVADPDYVRAEFAVIVASDLKGRGLGYQLMQLLLEYARAERLGEIHGQVLTENVAMLQLCRDLGFSIAAAAGDAGVVQVALTLRA